MKVPASPSKRPACSRTPLRRRRHPHWAPSSAASGGATCRQPGPGQTISRVGWPVPGQPIAKPGDAPYQPIDLATTISETYGLANPGRSSSHELDRRQRGYLPRLAVARWHRRTCLISQLREHAWRSQRSGRCPLSTGVPTSVVASGVIERVNVTVIADQLLLHPVPSSPSAAR